MLEALAYPDASSFLTLTYAPEHLPDGGTLVLKDLQLWLKRFRKDYGPLRYYAVGEYGDLTWRPHYHIALFGVPPSDAARDSVSRTWRYGLAHWGEITMHSAQYVAGYTVKRMTNADDPRLGGRYPEFCTMSLRPGIGASAVETMAQALLAESERRGRDWADDLPNVLRHGGRSLPLGRYLLARLRNRLDITDDIPVMAMDMRNEEMLALYKAALASPDKPLSFKHFLLEENAQKVRNVESKAKIYAKKGAV